MSNLRRRRYNLRPVAATSIVYPPVLTPPTDLIVSPASGQINIAGGVPTIVGASSGVPSNLVVSPSSGQIRIAGNVPIIINNSSGQTTYQPLTGFNIVQDTPVPPTMGTGGNDKFHIAKVVPIGGIGPFRYGLNDSAGGKYSLDSISGYLYPPYAQLGPNNDSIIVTVTDATGASKTGNGTIVKDSSNPTIFIEMPSVIPNNQDDWKHTTWNLKAYGTGYTSGVTYTFSDPSNNFDFAYGAIETIGAYRGQTHIVPLGNYQITMTATTAAGTITKNYTINVVPAVMGSIAFTPNVISTAVPAGWVVGTAMATTPQNMPLWSLINDGGGKYIIDPDTGIVTVFADGVLTVTTDTIVIGCSERGANQSGSFQIPVVAGTLLSSTNMRIPNLNQSLTNYAPNFNDVARLVGNPTVSGFPDSSKIRWSMKQQRFSTSMIYDLHEYARGWLRFLIDPLNGQVTAKAQLSATTGQGDWIDLTASDGINVCKNRFYVPVAATIGPTYHVGRGMSNATTRANSASLMGVSAGAAGYEHLGTCMHNFINGVGMQATAGATVYIHYDSDPEYYTADYADSVTFPGTHYEYGIFGPVSFIGVVGPQGQFPRLGGPINGYGAGNGGKGFFLLNDGDWYFKNLEISFVRTGTFGANRLPATNYTFSGIRFNQYCSGILKIENCYIHDCNLCIETGATDGELILINTIFENAAACTSAAGANQHNAYIGRMWRVTVDGCQFKNAMAGHIIKCRGTFGTWTNTRFNDGTRGSAFCQIDLCDGGTHTIDNCVFDKGAMPQNPFSIQFNEEGGWPLHEDVPAVLTITNSKFISRTMHVQSVFVAAVSQMGGMSPTTRQYSQVTLQNCQLINYPPGSQVATMTSGYPNDPSAPYLPAGDTHDFTPQMINCTYVPNVPLLDFTRPTTYQYGRPGFYDASADLDNPVRFPSMGGVQIDPGVDQIRIPANSPSGTVVFNPTAFGAWTWANSGNPQPDPNINPFVSGSVWAVGTNIRDPYGVSWGLAQSTYNVNPVNGQVTVGSSGAGAIGIDFFAIKVTSPASTGSKVAEYVFPIEKY